MLVKAAEPSLHLPSPPPPPSYYFPPYYFPPSHPLLWPLAPCPPQAMVYGNLSEVTSGTGVCFTRSPVNGNKELFGEFLANAQV